VWQRPVDEATQLLGRLARIVHPDQGSQTG
jgi:hypothetical protein